jgi:hypothetical protein
MILLVIDNPLEGGLTMKLTEGNRQGQAMKRMLAENPGQVFQEVISKQEVDQVCREINYCFRKRVFTPLVTLWTFLDQVLNADSSCSHAVARTLTFLSSTAGLEASHDPSAYARARKRLPAELLPRLTRMVSGKLQLKVPPEQSWHGRCPKLLDGSTVAMWDTASNQAAFPQPNTQKPGCGFPVARIEGLFDLLTGALLDMAKGPLSVSETALFRQLSITLEPQDLVVADCYYCSYAEIALLQRQQVDAVFCLHQRRVADFRQGKRLGRHDRRVQWNKDTRPQWMTPEQFATLPDTLTIRLIRVPGVKSKGRPLVIATTLLDPELYPASDIAALFGRRWEVETDFDHLKTTMQLEFLRTRSPEMVDRELWAHLLAYNLIRTLMWEAAQRRRIDPLRLSFKAAIQEMHALWPFTALTNHPHDLTAFYDALLKFIGQHRVPHRPGRREPRVLKRRNKGFPFMTKPRAAYRRTAHA